MKNTYTNIPRFVGKIFTEIIVPDDKRSITFLTNEGEKYLMYHEQDCCEDVLVDDIVGDLDDIKNTEILSAEVVTQNPKNIKGHIPKDDSETWTFYHIRSIKGTVSIKWWGSSNGYYSEDVKIIQTT